MVLNHDKYLSDKLGTYLADHCILQIEQMIVPIAMIMIVQIVRMIAIVQKTVKVKKDRTFDVDVDVDVT